MNGPPPETVLQVVKPLYGIPEAGLHWYITYLSHQLDTLGLTRSRYDPCLLLKHTKGNPTAMVALQVEQNLGFGYKAFLKLEEAASHKLWLVSPFPVESPAVICSTDSGTNSVFGTKTCLVMWIDRTEQIATSMSDF